MKSWKIGLVILLVGLVACADLKVRFNKPAMAREGGFQIAQAVLKYTPEGQQEGWHGYLATSFPSIKAQLENPAQVIMADWLKMVLYQAIDTMLHAIEIPLDEDILDLIRRSQEFFYFECEGADSVGFLCEVTPEARVLGIAFCDGVIQAVDAWAALPAPGYPVGE